MFGTTKEGNQSSGQAPFLDMPYIGPARLVSVYKDEIKGNDGTIYENVLKFRFKCLGEDVQGNSVKGHVVEKAEWPPREDDDAEKNKNKSDRIGYIMHYFMPDEEAVIPQQETWEQFVDQVLKRFDNNSNFSEVPIRLKVPANEYQGQVNLQIPNYKGFIQGEDSEEAISFTRSEKEDNRKYISAQTMPSEEEPAGATAEEEDDLF